jgi:hypothetical protein
LSEQICYSHPFLTFPQEQISTSKNARPVACSQLKRILLGHGCVAALGAALALALVSSPAAAKYKSRYKHRAAEHAANEPFGTMPKGPLQIFISINQQRLHFYSDGLHVADVPVATGVPGHPTPRGVFDVIQRDRYHHSNIYSNAPMPYMERITWSGVALHEGPGVGHEASHGCIRMPHDFAARLWRLPTMGMRVVITRPELRPTDIADPHLFVHKDRPMPVAPLTAQVATAQTNGTKTDAGQPGSASAGAAAPGALQGTEPVTTGAAPSMAAPPPDSAAPDRPGQAANGQAAMAPNATPQSADPTRNPATADAPPASDPSEVTKSAAAENKMTAPISLDDLPLPPAKPEQLVRSQNAPIAIFISRKLGKIFVRQDFEPLFDAPVKIENPDEPLGTHVFTALNYLPDHSTLQWNVVSLPGEPKKVSAHWEYVTTPYGSRKRVRVKARLADPWAAPETPQEALSRITIPQEVIDKISQLIVPGSSVTISDQGLGPETGKGTDFIVVEH